MVLYPANSIGAISMVILGWKLVVWTESETNMAAVWLFVAQVVTMLIPPSTVCTTLSIV